MKTKLKLFTLIIVCILTFAFSGYTTIYAENAKDAKTEQTHQIKKKKCDTCRGMGTCHSCGGDGTAKKIGFPKRKCGLCLGSGRCVMCKGKGVR